MAGKPADLFMGRLRVVIVSVPLHHRPCGSAYQRKAPDRRYRVHVRSAPLVTDPAAEPVSCCDSAPSIVGNSASRLRLARLDLPNHHNLDCCAHQLFLAPSAGRELGTRPILPRAACDARLDLSARLPCSCTALYLFADTALS